ncbi:MAG: hypothetical protein WBN89_06435 [Prochlorococcaceae cyanobacterium]
MRRQIDLGIGRLQEANPGLYRDLALYLQVLRELLPEAVETGLFHLSTRLQPQRYCELPAERRHGLHERAAALVQHAGSLITVEQLAQLAAALAAGRQQQQRDWLARLRAATAGGEAAGLTGSGNEPEGSVRLSLEPPLTLNGLPGFAAWPASEGHGEGAADRSPAIGRHPEADLVGDAGFVADTGLDGLPEDLPLSGAVPHAEAAREGLPPPPWDSGQLPSEPVALLTWLDGFERALVRRLLDLSHALNAELLRAGLSQSLLPLPLLDAALNGQLEQLAAPANLLRVQLPVPDPLAGSHEAVALLLRTADLELEHPRLRSCRSRLQRHRQEVRRMAEQHRRLRQRLQALEAERLWRQDNPRYRQL